MTKSMIEERVTPYINELGQEVLSKVAVEIPGGLHRPPSLIEQMRMMVRQEFSRHAASQGYESFEESDDFDVDDEWELEPSSAYEDETIFEPEVKNEPAKVGDNSGDSAVGDTGAQGSAPQGGTGESGAAPA